MIKIAPSILTADFGRLAEEIRQLEQFDNTILHLDVMDGNFVPNISFGIPLIESLRKQSKLFFDVHLMIERPEHLIEAFAKAGADGITVHVESTPHVHRCLQMIHSCGCKAAAALNPSTPLCTLNHILDDLSMVLLMSVNPGYGGQKYIESTTEKINDLKKMIGTRDIHIQVDGGIKADNIKKVVDAGADILVCGSAVYDGVSASDNIKKLNERILL